MRYQIRHQGEETEKFNFFQTGIVAGLDVISQKIAKKPMLSGAYLNAVEEGSVGAS